MGDQLSLQLLDDVIRACFPLHERWDVLQASRRYLDWLNALPVTHDVPNH